MSVGAQVITYARDRRASARPVYGAGDEVAFWVPSEVADIMEGFARDHAAEASRNAIGECLLRMGRVWAQREGRRVQRVREKLSSQLRELQRRAGQALPYITVMQARHTARHTRGAHAVHTRCTCGSRYAVP